MDNDLSEIRKRIDSIDQQIVALLNRRAAEVLRIGALKRARGIPTTDLLREEDVCRRVTGESAGVIDDDALVRIFRQILAESRRMQVRQTKQDISAMEVR
jgi:chorismate mutase